MQSLSIWFDDSCAVQCLCRIGAQNVPALHVRHGSRPSCDLVLECWS